MAWKVLWCERSPEPRLKAPDTETAVAHPGRFPRSVAHGIDLAGVGESAAIGCSVAIVVVIFMFVLIILTSDR